MGGGDGLDFVVGNRLLVVVRRRCAGLGGRFRHLHDGRHWGVPFFLSLMDAGRRPGDTGVCRADG